MTSDQNKGLSSQIFSWLLHKMTYAALLTVLGLVGAGLGIFLYESDDVFAQQRQMVKGLNAENLRLSAALTSAGSRMLSTRTEISAQQLRLDQAAKVVRNLDELSSGLNRFTTSAAQLEENDRRLTRMKEMEIDSHKRVVDLGQNLIRLQWEKDGIEIALERNRSQLKAAATEKSFLVHYATRAWVDWGKIVLAAVALVMVGPFTWRILRAR